MTTPHPFKQKIDLMSIHAPLLMTLEMDPMTFALMNELRSRYFPPERNFIPAHISMFQHLPAEENAAIRRTLTEVSNHADPLDLRFTKLKRLGKGMAISAEVPGLAAIHRHLAREFDVWLTPQDRQPYRPHVTIMNKAEPYLAALAFAELSAEWSPRSGTATGLLLWEYLGGPWRLVEQYRFAAGSDTIEDCIEAL